MAISTDLNLFRSFLPHQLHPRRNSLSHSKMSYAQFPFGGSHDFINDTHKYPLHCLWTNGDKLNPSTMNNNDAEEFLHNSIDKSFSKRLSLAWKTLFPSTKQKNSNASIAKQRLKMILYSDRCEVSDEAKQKIVSSIVKALSDFVEIESQGNVQLNVSTDPGLGTVYSVIVPVRRVKPEYQESNEHYIGKITGVEYKDKGEESGMVDVRFNFFVPDDKL